MKVKYDKETDILYIRLSDEKVMESDETKKGIILDYSEENHLVGIEILNASKSSYSAFQGGIRSSLMITTKSTKLPLTTIPNF